MPLGGPPRRGKPSPKEMREILTDWYLAVWVQKQTGNATVGDYPFDTPMIESMRVTGRIVGAGYSGILRAQNSLVGLGDG